MPLWQVVKLIGIQLVNFRAKTDWLSDDLPPTPPDLGISIDSKFEDRKADQSLHVLVTFAVFPVDQEGRAADPAQFRVEATYRATYFYPPGYVIDKKDATDFSNRNAPFNLYPYWRELVHSVSGRMEIPFGPLPLYRVPPPQAKKKPSSQTKKKLPPQPKKKPLEKPAAASPKTPSARKARGARGKTVRKTKRQR